MGTNYYLLHDVCPHCGRGDEPLHIGKSSAGWCFALHVIPEEGLNSLDDWRERFGADGSKIEDEYGREHSPSDMLRVITERRWPQGSKEKPYFYDSWATFHHVNHSEPGPRNLLRCQLGRHCIGHGAGTWDLIPDEFR